jgi:hypothetical protein
MTSENPVPWQAFAAVPSHGNRRRVKKGSMAKLHARDFASLHLPQKPLESWTASWREKHLQKLGRVAEFPGILFSHVFSVGNRLQNASPMPARPAEFAVSHFVSLA